MFPDRQNTNGCVYIASSEDKIKKSLYKIGYTSKTPNKRNLSLQTADPDIEILYTHDCKDIIMCRKKYTHVFI